MRLPHQQPMNNASSYQATVTIRVSESHQQCFLRNNCSSSSSHLSNDKSNNNNNNNKEEEKEEEEKEGSKDYIIDMPMGSQLLLNHLTNLLLIRHHDYFTRLPHPHSLHAHNKNYQMKSKMRFCTIIHIQKGDFVAVVIIIITIIMKIIKTVC